MASEVLTADDSRVRACTADGLGHDWRPYEYLQFNRTHTSWRCVWCHAVACGNYGAPDPCWLPHHHSGPHHSRRGVEWPIGGNP